ncbi:hypothetical protein J6590_038211 [Homalodisca vitripennis]|nr:hypothetical protein J6590_038211 [Homalodisca vitripennis]
MQVNVISLHMGHFGLWRSPPQESTACGNFSLNSLLVGESTLHVGLRPIKVLASAAILPLHRRTTTTGDEPTQVPRS